MKSEPTQLQRLLLGSIGVVVSLALGLWLSLSYFGVVTNDAKVSVEVQRVGDAIGPGSKVRYHGIIVGRVLRLSEHDGAYRLNLLVKEAHARSIPSTATARILPSTVFGSEYVELLSTDDASNANHLVSGDVLAADTTHETLRLMESFDEAERLLSALDAEDINRITGKLAPALAGNGKDIKDFLERADRVVTDVNRDLPTTWETLTLAVTALDTIAEAEPDLVSAMDHSRTTTGMIADQDDKIGEVLDGSAKTVASADTLFAGLRDILVPFVSRLERLTALAADNASSVRQILSRFALTGSNGAAGVDGNAIQMIGTIGLDLPQAYTAADCTRYGPTLVASNCGGPVPSPSHANAADAGGLDKVADRIAAILQQELAEAVKGDEPGASTTEPVPGATPQTTPPNGLIALLPGLLGGLLR